MATMENDKPQAIGSDAASDSEKRVQTAAQAEAAKPKGLSAVAVLWTFGKCLGALLPVYLAGYYRVSTSLLVCGMMVYTGWKHAREAKEARLKSAIEFLNSEDECTSRQMSRIKRELPAWVRNAPLRRGKTADLPSYTVLFNPTVTPSSPHMEPVDSKVVIAQIKSPKSTVLQKSLLQLYLC